MSLVPAPFRLWALLLLSLALAGCLPASSGKLDEHKDPHYLKGRARVAGLDYKGAIEEFEKALEANPRSAAAHLELALLYEDHMKDYAAAIHHYERHLKYRPNSEYLDRARDRIKNCKMELVRSEVIGPVTQGMQRDLERLLSENLVLKQRIEVLETQLNQRTQQPLPVQPGPAQPRPPAPAPEPVRNQPVAAVQHNPPPAAPAEPPRARRTHVVKAGDKLTTIARQYGVELSRLMQANPGVDPTRLQIGQAINIP